MVKQTNFTAIDNDVLEALMGANLTGAEFRVTLMMVRMTAGFHKRPDTSDLGVSKIMRGILGADGSLKVHGTNLSRRGVLAALKSLTDRKKILRVVSKGTYHHDENVYAIRPVEEWRSTGAPHRTSARPRTSEDTSEPNASISGAEIQPSSARPRRTLVQEDILAGAQPCTSASVEATPEGVELNQKKDSLKENLKESSTRARKNKKETVSREGAAPPEPPDGGSVSLNEENGWNEELDLASIWKQILGNIPDELTKSPTMAILKSGELVGIENHTLRVVLTAQIFKRKLEEPTNKAQVKNMLHHSTGEELEVEYVVATHKETRRPEGR